MDNRLGDRQVVVFQKNKCISARAKKRDFCTRNVQVFGVQENGYRNPLLGQIELTCGKCQENKNGCYFFAAQNWPVENGM